MDHVGTSQLPSLFSRWKHLFHLSFLSPLEKLLQHVERLWQLDIPLFRNRKKVIRSGEDIAAVEQLEQKTVRVTVHGMSCYATPLLHKQNSPMLQTTPSSGMALLRATELRFIKDPEQSASAMRRTCIHFTWINVSRPCSIRSMLNTSSKNESNSCQWGLWHTTMG